VGVGATFFALSVLGLGAFGILTYSRQTKAVEKAPGEAVEARLAALEVTVMGLPSLWEEERKRAFRYADSARKSEASAEEKLALVEEITDAATDLREPDGDGGEEQWVPTVLPRLGNAPEPNREDRLAAVAHLLR